VLGPTLVILLVLALNVCVSLGLQWVLPSEDAMELFFVPFLMAPVGGAILACLHGLAPRYKWRSAFGLSLLTAALMGVWAIALLFPPFLAVALMAGGIGYMGGLGTWIQPETLRVRNALTVLGLLLFTYVNVLTMAYIPGVREAAYPWRLVKAAMHEERDRLLAAARELGIDPAKEMTAAQAKALDQRMGPDRVIELPLLGRSVKIQRHEDPRLNLMISWGDGRRGMIDLKTLAIPYVYD
jgi:hypothetical protein